MDSETFHAICQRLRLELSQLEQEAPTAEDTTSIFEPALVPTTTSVLRILREAFPHVNALVLEGIYYRILQIDGRRCIWKYEQRRKLPFEVWTEWEALWSRSSGEEASKEGPGNSGRTDESDGNISLAGSMLIIHMARAYDGVSPCHLARQIVRGYAETFNEAARREWQTKREAIQAEADPTRSQSRDGANVGLPVPSYPRKLNHVRLYREPSSIPHKGLAANVIRCHRLDPHCSPAMDEYRTRIGKQYEDRLEAALTALGVPFLNEVAMRRLKYARTPDTILLEPIAIDGLPVKWIESKAWFGDPTAHPTYLRDQYWPYYNRFGPGLVIYWFGYVREPTEAHRHQGILVMDTFPPSAEGSDRTDPVRITRITSPLTDLVLSSQPDLADGDTGSS